MDGVRPPIVFAEDANVERAARVIAAAAVKHLAARMPENLASDQIFIAEIENACQGAVARSIHTATIPPEEDKRLYGPPRNSIAEIVADLDAEERPHCRRMAHRAIEIGKITDEHLKLGAWEWAHDQAILLIAGRRRG